MLYDTAVVQVNLNAEKSKRGRQISNLEQGARPSLSFKILNISLQTSPLTVTLVTVTPRFEWLFWHFPNGLSYIINDVVRVTLAYSDTFLSTWGEGVIVSGRSVVWSKGCLNLTHEARSARYSKMRDSRNLLHVPKICVQRACLCLSVQHLFFINKSGTSFGKDNLADQSETLNNTT